MFKSKFFQIWLAIIMITGLIGYCNYGQAAPNPKELKMALVFVSITEEPWNTALLQSLERVQEAKPHSLTITYDYTENVFYPDAERVLRNYAKTGKYGIIWAHSAYADAISKVHSDYPEILWVCSGEGNKPVGGNAYLIDCCYYEPAYLLGVIAGMMTESNVISTVSGFPFGAISRAINAYNSGAQSINPDIKTEVTFIESWFDPPKAKEAALAQIATGADFIYAERFGPFEACKEKGKFAFGNMVDQNSLAPNVVISSTIVLWDPAIYFLIDAWWNHETINIPYNAPVMMIEWLMKDGGSNIASYHDLASRIPEKVKKAVEETKQKIREGTLIVPRNDTPPESD